MIDDRWGKRGFRLGLLAGVVVLVLVGYYFYLPEIEDLVEGLLYLVGLDRGGPTSY